MGEYDQGVLQADAAKESNVQLFLFSTLPYVGPEYMGLGGVELYDEKEKPVVFLWVEHDLGPSTLAIAEAFRTSGKPLSEHYLNHTIQPVGSWRGTWGEVSREIERQTRLETRHTVM
ncbi:hypothetical protein C0993_006857 [Termitomyces sp. T159_Od127]|nr:hypothetical protein C0993_006857 [Termitomyces sp. T159_Od127]